MKNRNRAASGGKRQQHQGESRSELLKAQGREIGSPEMSDLECVAYALKDIQRALLSSPVLPGLTFQENRRVRSTVL